MKASVPPVGGLQQSPRPPLETKTRAKSAAAHGAAAVRRRPAVAGGRAAFAAPPARAHHSRGAVIRFCQIDPDSCNFHLRPLLVLRRWSKLPSWPIEAVLEPGAVHPITSSPGNNVSSDVTFRQPPWQRWDQTSRAENYPVRTKSAWSSRATARLSRSRTYFVSGR